MSHRYKESSSFGNHERPLIGKNMRALILALVLAGSCVSQSALAGSVTDALQDFGLLGAWSPNCAQNPEDLSLRPEAGIVPVRWIYSPGIISTPTLTLLQLLRQGLMTTRLEIKTAEQITADEIKYRTFHISAQLGYNTEQSFPNPMSVTTVVEKVNDKITVVSQIAEDGTAYVERGLSIVRMADHGQMKEVNRIPFGIFKQCLN